MATEQLEHAVTLDFIGVLKEFCGTLPVINYGDAWKEIWLWHGYMCNGQLHESNLSTIIGDPYTFITKPNQEYVIQFYSWLGGKFPGGQLDQRVIWDVSW